MWGVLCSNYYCYNIPSFFIKHYHYFPPPPLIRLLTDLMYIGVSLRGGLASHVTFVSQLDLSLRNRVSEEGGESLVTTELYDVRALIVFIMVMTTFYAYMIIIRTVTSREHGVQD